MNTEDRQERVHLHADLEIMTQPPAWWWLSFVDDNLPQGGQFIGACIVRAHGMVSAVREAHEQSCNPGGQVQGTPFPDHVDLTEWANRLLSRNQVSEFDQWMTRTYP